MKTTVVNIKTGADYDIYAGRNYAGKVPEPPQYGFLGNPFKHNIPAFREYFRAKIMTNPIFKAAVEGARGKRLGCFCVPDKACHASVIAEWLDTGSFWIEEEIDA